MVWITDAVEYFDHHAHGRFLMTASPLPGFSHREQALIAVMVSGHRKGKPHVGRLSPLLSEGDSERIGRLGGMLRLAEYLERTKSQCIDGLRCHLGSGYLQVEVTARGPAVVEIDWANRRSDLLAKSFGVTVEVVLSGTIGGGPVHQTESTG